MRWQHIACKLFGHREGPMQDSEPTSYGVRSQFVVCQRCGQVVRAILVNDGVSPTWEDRT